MVLAIVVVIIIMEGFVVTKKERILDVKLDIRSRSGVCGGVQMRQSGHGPRSTALSRAGPHAGIKRRVRVGVTLENIQSIINRLTTNPMIDWIAIDSIEGIID